MINEIRQLFDTLKTRLMAYAAASLTLAQTALKELERVEHALMNRQVDQDALASALTAAQRAAEMVDLWSPLFPALRQLESSLNEGSDEPLDGIWDAYGEGCTDLGCFPEAMHYATEAWLAAMEGSLPTAEAAAETAASMCPGFRPMLDEIRKAKAALLKRLQESEESAPDTVNVNPALGAPLPVDPLNAAPTPQNDMPSFSFFVGCDGIQAREDLAQELARQLACRVQKESLSAAGSVLRVICSSADARRRLMADLSRRGLRLIL